jgi:hypothetical protein
LVEKSESLECWILRIVIRSWTLDFYNEVGFRHLIRSKGAIGSQVEEEEGDLESHGVVCEHDWKKIQISKKKRIKYIFFFHQNVIDEEEFTNVI